MRSGRLNGALAVKMWLFLSVVVTGALAQPDPSQMSGIPRPDPNLSDGVITVRVIRGSFANNVIGQPVELRAGDRVLTEETDVEGRATFAVLSNAFAGGPTAKEMLRPGLHLVLVETFALLFSSITYGMAMLATYRGDKAAVLRWLGITFLFGVSFISIELYEFRHLIHEGAGPQTSAYWSAFFTLVGTHGLHVSAGLLWMLVLMPFLQKLSIHLTGIKLSARR